MKITHNEAVQIRSSAPSEIQLFDTNGNPVGIGRIWESGRAWSWAHPDGSQGSNESFEQAMQELGCISDSKFTQEL